MRFEISSTEWSVLARVMADNVEKCEANCCALLDVGEIITGVTAAVTSGAASTVTGVDTTHDKKTFLWFVNAASVEESFTVRFTVTTNHGQTLVFPADFVIRVPS